MRRLIPLLTALIFLIFAGCGANSVQKAPTTTPVVPTVVATSPIIGPHSIWRPAPGASWQIQLQGWVDTSVDAQIYDIDPLPDASGGTTSDETMTQLVADLHAKGRKVICYVDVGSFENWRPDAASFPKSVLGKTYVGYTDEQWLDIRQLNVLAPILQKRFDLCKNSGFDGIDPDNVDGYQNATGFPITADDQLRFNRWLVQEAHNRGLSVGLKNDAEQAAQLEPQFDWSLTEDCYYQNWCDLLKPFAKDGKAIFSIEYTDSVPSLTPYCAPAKQSGISLILKHASLDSWRQTCP